MMANKGITQGQIDLIEFARAGGPTATVTPLTIPKVPTLQDDILEMLDGLAADIRSGKVTPSYLIIGFGDRIKLDGQPATSYVWDAAGLDTPEVIGHLYTYATKLALGEGE